MISHKRLRKILSYDEATGDFTWLEKISVKVVVGRKAGGLNLMGYVVIGINGKAYYAHRLAWFYVNGEWPRQLDHADGDKANNRIVNLREASHQQNILNAKLFSTNTSGFKGVSWHKGAGKWMSSITIDGESVYLGLHQTIEDAAAAYMNAAIAAQPKFARAR